MLIEFTTRAYVNSLSENDRNSRDMFTVFIERNKEFDYKNLIKWDNSTVQRDPSSGNEVRNKKIVNDSAGESNIKR